MGRRPKHNEKLTRSCIELFYFDRQNLSKELDKNKDVFEQIVKVFENKKLTLNMKKRFLYDEIELSENEKDVLWERYMGDRLFVKSYKEYDWGLDNG
jgi:hypothetical protein